MNFKTAININTQLKSIYEMLNIKTSMGRDMLFNSEFICDENSLNKTYQLIESCQNFLDKQSSKDIHNLECVLYDIHNITNSIMMIDNNKVLDDVGLFEVKAFCLNCKKLKFILKDLIDEEFVLDDFQEIITLLDPEGLEVKQFYVYSLYNKELSEKRKIFEQYKLNDNPDTDKIYNELMEIENNVREMLCKKIKPFKDKILKAINTVALLDVSIAKGELNKLLNLTKPTINKSLSISYTKVFNPIVKQALNKNGKDFQAIDINLDSTTSLITGANMAGKTVILKTLALCQYMIQFGFFVPCEKCCVCLVNEVLTSIGDNQNENEGLSSFASEILNLNDIVKKVKTKQTYLVLVDELARTTNPIEGVRLLNGFIKTLSMGCSLNVITTHYSDIKVKCRRLRVKGFNKENISCTIDIKNLSDYIDYSLIEDTTNTTPNEALNLCKILGIDSCWLNNCN